MAFADHGEIDRRRRSPPRTTSAGGDSSASPAPVSTSRTCSPARAGGRGQVREVVEGALETVRGQMEKTGRPGMTRPPGTRALGRTAFELSFGYRDEAAFSSVVEPLVTDRVASGIAAQTRPSGAPTPSPRPASGSRGWPCRGVAPAGRRDRGLRVARRPGPDPSCCAAWAAPRSRPRSSARAHGAELTVLDSSDPDYVRSALTDQLERTVVVVSSKSGGTVETDSQQPRLRAGVQGRRPRAGRAHHRRHRPRLARSTSRRPRRATASSTPTRTSAVATPRSPPSGWCPADSPAPTSAGCSTRRRRSGRGWRPTTPTTRRSGSGALLGVANHAGADKLVLADDGLAVSPASATGPSSCRRVHGRGRQGHPAGRRSRTRQLRPQHPRRGPRHDRRRRVPLTPRRVRLGRRRRRPARRAAAAVGVRHRGRRPDIGINPFDQPDVESAKQAAREMLDGAGASPHAGVHRRPRRRSTPPTAGCPRGSPPSPTRSPRCSTGSTTSTATSPCRPTSTGTATPRWPTCATPLAVAHRPPGHVRLGPAVPALHRAVPQGRPADRGLPPGHRRAGADLAVPDRPFTFHEFLTAQAVGDGQVLADTAAPCCACT